MIRDRWTGEILTPAEEEAWERAFTHWSSGAWQGEGELGERPCGIHPAANIGGPPESREWVLGDTYHAPAIAPSALVHAFSTIDGGRFHPTRIGARSFLMARCHVAHDVVIGEDCELGAGVVLCGHVKIGDRVKIGGNAWIKPYVRVGDDARIGGGAVVTKDVPAGETWAGNPASPLEKGRLWEARDA